MAPRVKNRKDSKGEKAQNKVHITRRAAKEKSKDVTAAAWQQVTEALAKAVETQIQEMPDNPSDDLTNRLNNIESEEDEGHEGTYDESYVDDAGSGGEEASTSSDEKPRKPVPDFTLRRKNRK